MDILQVLLTLGHKLNNNFFIDCFYTIGMIEVL